MLGESNTLIFYAGIKQIEKKIYTAELIEKYTLYVLCWIPVGIQSILLFSNVPSSMYHLYWTFIRLKLELSTGNNSQKPTSWAQVSGKGPAKHETCAVSGIWMSRRINKLSKIHDFLPVSYSEKHQMSHFSHDFTHQEDSGKAKNLMLFATAGNFSRYIAPIILFYNYI